MFGVETHSFLPNQQSDGCHLARQCKSRHRRLHSAGQASFVELLEWSGDNRCPRGGALEDVFQIMVMVEVEAANGQDLFGSLELSSDETILPAGVGFQRQATIRPELSLGTEAVRRLDQSNQQSGADGTDGGNLSEQPGRAVFVALMQ